MGLFGLVFLVIALILIGVGIAVGLMLGGLTVVLIGLGVVSSSFVIGLRSRRPAAGLKAFLLQCGILAGIPVGAVSAWLGKAFFTAYGSELPILACGALGGAVAGMVVALSVDFILRRLHGWASARVLQSGSEAPPAIERGA